MPGGTGGETDVLLLRQAVGLGRSRSSWCLSDPVQPSWMDAAFQEAEGLLLALKSPLHFVALGVAHNQFMANKSGWRNGRVMVLNESHGLGHRCERLGRARQGEQINGLYMAAWCSVPVVRLPMA